MPKVKCEVCGKWFKNKRSLEMHVSKLHNNENPSDNFSEPLQTYSDLSDKTEEAKIVQSLKTPVLPSPFESKESREEIRDSDVFMSVFLASLNYDIPEISKKWGKFRALK